MLTRNRQSGSLSIITPGYTGANWPVSCSNRTWTSDTTYSNTVKVGSLKTMTDRVTPGYHRRRKAGEIVFSPMSVTKTTATYDECGSLIHVRAATPGCTNPTAYGEVRYGGMYPACIGAQFGLSNGVPPDQYLVPDSDVNDAIREVTTRVLSQRGAAANNLFESAAQYEKTLGMASTIYKEAATILGRIPQSKVKAAASAYLLYRYGLRPLVQDLTAIVEGLQATERVAKRTTRANVSIHRQNNTVVTQTNASSQFNILHTVGRQEACIVRAMSLDEYRTSKSFEAGISLTGLAMTPWELIPLSFVADWFTNVGDYIGSFVPTPSFTQLGSCLVVDRTLVTTYTHSDTVAKNGCTVLNAGAGSVYSVVRQTKSRSLGLTDTGIVVRSSFKFDRDHLTRIGDAAALIVALFVPQKRGR